MKGRILAFARARGLLGLADRLMMVRSRTRSRAGNRAFALAHPGFVAPPDDLAFDAYHHVDWRAYYEVGRTHAQAYADVIAGSGLGPRLSILEWGCGPGRLIRHMRDCLPGVAVELTGSDYNRRSIAWCSEHIPDASFVVNELDPPLCFEDDRFDVVYCFSVLTHLSEAVQLAWVAELRRVLKPGGLLICSTHGDLYGQRLAVRHEAGRYRQGEIIVQDGYDEGKKWFLALHPPAYVRRTLLAGFTDIRSIEVPPEAAMTQDLWSARKPTTQAPVQPLEAGPPGTRAWDGDGIPAHTPQLQDVPKKTL